MTKAEKFLAEAKDPMARFFTDEGAVRPVVEKIIRKFGRDNNQSFRIQDSIRGPVIVDVRDVQGKEKLITYALVGDFITTHIDLFDHIKER